MDESGQTTTVWWGTFDIPPGTLRRWRIGPMTMWIERLPGEWRIATETDEREDLRSVVVDDLSDAKDLIAMDNVARFGTSGDSMTITITPLLADRPVITTPRKPFYIAADERVSVFVGSPLWLRVQAGDSTNALLELPIVRPSDTWFGENTYVGEMCYASRTSCRLRLDDMSLQPHRAVTTVLVHNVSSSSLLLERMKLPVAYLPLFCSEEGVFFTSDMAITYKGADAMATLRQQGDVPSRAPSARLITPPRSRADDNLAMKVFTSLFGWS